MHNVRSWHLAAQRVPRLQRANRQSMKLHLQSGVVQLVTGTGEGWVRVNADEYRESLVLTPDAVFPCAAPGGYAALTAADFAALLVHRPEIVLLGTGAIVGLLSGGPPLKRALRQLGIGYGAAAATYLLGLLFGTTLG